VTAIPVWRRLRHDSASGMCPNVADGGGSVRGRAEVAENPAGVGGLPWFAGRFGGVLLVRLGDEPADRVLGEQLVGPHGQPFLHGAVGGDHGGCFLVRFDAELVEVAGFGDD